LFKLFTFIINKNEYFINNINNIKNNYLTLLIMSIKYAEITIIFDTVNEGFFTALKRNLFGIETFCDEETEIIISFDDKNVCVKNEYKDCNFEFYKVSSLLLPIYFEAKENEKFRHMYFQRLPIKREDGNLQLDFTSIINTPELKYKYKNIGSYFNCIYYCHKDGTKNVFSILKLYSNQDKPRFLLAYDSEEFTQEEIIYLVNCIFKNKYNTDV
jgi:hypothetical protein